MCDENGVQKVRYAYDAWGNCTIVTGAGLDIAKTNPIRYRGYYYDRETGLYYCNARYYNSQWRRFISPDDTAYLDPNTINGLNLYCYCGNDPVNYYDPSGHLAFLLAMAIVGAACGFGIAAYKDYQADGIWFNGNIGGYFAYTLGGALLGAGVGAGVSALLTGSFASSIGAVKTGAMLTYQMYSAAGLGAAKAMMQSNFSNALHYSTHVFWSGGELSMNSAKYLAQDIGGTTLEMTKLGQYLSKLPSFNAEAWRIASTNFANQVPGGSTAFTVLNSAGPRLDSIWVTVEHPILLKKILDLIVVMVNGGV